MSNEIDLSDIAADSPDEAEAIAKIDMREVVAVCKLLASQLEACERLDAEYKAARNAYLRTERETLPDLMAEIGMTKLTLDDGTNIVVKPDADAAITDKTRAGALKWLIANEFGGLIKTTVSLQFGRGDRAAATKYLKTVLKKHENVVLKEEVHHSTLKAFVLEQLRDAKKIPMDLFNVRPFNKAVVKQPKGKK